MGSVGGFVLQHFFMFLVFLKARNQSWGPDSLIPNICKIWPLAHWQELACTNWDYTMGSDCVTLYPWAAFIYIYIFNFIILLIFFIIILILFCTGFRYVTVVRQSYTLKCSPWYFQYPAGNHVQLLQYNGLYFLCYIFHPCDYFVTASLYFLIPPPLSPNPTPLATNHRFALCIYESVSIQFVFRFHIQVWYLSFSDLFH